MSILSVNSTKLDLLDGITKQWNGIRLFAKELHLNTDSIARSWELTQFCL